MTYSHLQDTCRSLKNPAFGHHPSWWDILVDLEAGTLKISSSIGIPGPPLPTKSLSHAEKLAQHNNLISSHEPRGCGFHHGLEGDDFRPVSESSIRARCRNYIKRFIRISTNYEEFEYSKTELLWPSPADPNYEVVPGYGYTWISDAKHISTLTATRPWLRAGVCRAAISTTSRSRSAFGLKFPRVCMTLTTLWTSLDTISWRTKSQGQSTCRCPSMFRMNRT